MPNKTSDFEDALVVNTTPKIDLITALRNATGSVWNEPVYLYLSLIHISIITQNSIYKSIDNYIFNLISKISDSDPVKKSNIIQSLESISKELWDNSVRSISYPDNYISLIKGNSDPFIGSIAHSMMDEGMFFIRDINNDLSLIHIFHI